jgi:hypothetical protein
VSFEVTQERLPVNVEDAYDALVSAAAQDLAIFRTKPRPERGLLELAKRLHDLVRAGVQQLNLSTKNKDKLRV